MQFPESWLREFCNPPLTTSQLAERLTMAGLEVENLQAVAPAFSHIVVGEIKEAVQHPNADRLRVCQVDVGQSALLNIVCGAPNARAGIKVPCALVGAELPTDGAGKTLLIKVGKLRGVESFGMLCSARELKLSQDHAGLLELAQDAPVGQDLRQYLTLDDTLFTLKLTPNLAHCLSVYGVARELSALTGAPLMQPKFVPVSSTIPDILPVHVSAPDLCGRFSGRIIRALNPAAKTPSWMLERLAHCGQRSVSALVDISNYVMFEFGRPSHIFDLDKIHGALDVRWGRHGEPLTLLNGTTITVDARVGVIADAQQLESLAGIMGGAATAVSDETQNIYLEAAFWWPKAIAGRSRRFNFATDAGHRFERGVDAELTVEHIERISQLIIDICGTAQTACGPIDDQRLALVEPIRLSLRVARASKVLGMALTQEQCVAALHGLGLPLEQGDGVVTVTAPSYRFDLQIEEDLIEEVGRMVGYHNLPQTPPVAPITARVRTQTSRSAFALRRTLAALGYQETINFSFVDARWEAELANNPNPIKLLNPIANQMSVMRSSLIGSLLQVLKFNQDRKAERVRIFELGRVFLRNPNVLSSDTSVQGFEQPMRLAALAVGASDAPHWSAKARPVDFYDLTGDLQAMLAPAHLTFTPLAHPALHPGRSAQVMLDGEAIGFVGELHPKWCQSYDLLQSPLVFEISLDAALKRELAHYSGVPKFQQVERDIALLVADRVTHTELMQAIWSVPLGGMLRDAVLFDIFRPLGSVQKSMAVRLTLNGADVALSDAQIDAAVQSVVATLASKLGARLRA